MKSDDGRPDPDALLESIPAEERGPKKRGRLKIYLGMAAGVGKTFAMLSDALIDLRRGRNVVLGYIEPHGRVDTEILTKEFESIPQLVLNHRGVEIREFDIDSTLRRKPSIVLVDELAHTNAPGSRHEKRYLDIEELLAAGIDVRTTVNVQHIESLNDIVAKITDVPVQETVPDRVFLNADEVEVVDIPPDELVERIKEGKIYREEKIHDALRNFFTQSNLSSLRELTLRHAADRVGAKAWIQRGATGSGERWSGKERVLVCIAPDAYSVATVREARRLASMLNADLVALSVETPYYGADASRSGASDALSLAENLGATVIVRSATDVVEEIVRVSKEQRITQILIGKPPRRSILGRLRPNFLDKLLEGSRNISVHVVDIGPPTRYLRRAKLEVFNWATLPQIFAYPVLAVSLATAISWPLSYHLDKANIVMFYLVAATWAAAKLTRNQAVITVVLGVLAFDFLFVPPYFTFRVSDLQYLTTFAVMLGVGLVISELMSRLRAHSRIISDREQRTARLYELVNKLSEANNIESIAQIVAEQVRITFNLGAQLLVPKDESLISILSGDELTTKELGTALWALNNRQNAGKNTDTLPSSDWLFCPLKAGSSYVGVLAVKLGKRDLDRSRLSLLEAFASNIGLAIQRILSEERSKESFLRIEQEQMKGIFLSSVSHDLRTPLASIEGAAAAILTESSSLPNSVPALAQGIIEESQRLSGMIRNVLDITRIENSGVALNSDWYSVEELIGGALNRVDKLLGGRKITLSIPSDLPLVWVDGTLIEQLFVNLLENIVYHTPPETAAAIEASVVDGQLRIDLLDQGTGLSEEVLKNIFKPGNLVHSKKSVGGRTGFGLGLSICGGIAKAHGGTMTAYNSQKGGAVFRLILPIKSPPAEAVND